MRLVMIVSAFLGISATAFADNPPTFCYVYVVGDCHGRVPVNTWINDNYNGSGVNNGVCLHRAREYAAYCALNKPGQYVYAAFNQLQTTISAQIFSPGYGPGTGTATTMNYGLNWVPLVSSPSESVVLH